MTSDRQLFLDVAASAAVLLRDPAVAASWETDSALAELRVGGLAAHLAWQITVVPRLLAEPPPDERPVTLFDHYTTQAVWIGAPLDDDLNVLIRRASGEMAVAGPGALAAQAAAAIGELRDLLPAEPAGRLVSLASMVLSLDDFLATRILEIAVHSDDLAVSVGVPTPELPTRATDAVLALLTRLAVHRHGPTAVLRAFSRAERAPATITAI
ncbi:maleylpyruvate isomerase N-terminal domain-containing protein [Parafrankia discariae]|uniref:maleylpyruvate isomerase N-terminal domain-containing protein n=1 Tax=Parafrankia discariae TaxID=365528 RepID=UPI0003A8B0E5|nr:maleylpyruvate isomerase N-terminal domain-containing protein [Parafrankia discariae]